jgi:tetratricopeptide (TPR) repeat protein
VEIIRFSFWEGVKIIGLVFLGLVSTKAVTGLAVRGRWLKPVLYSVILGLVGVGAWYAGNDLAAEVYMWSADSSLARGDLDKGYANALAAVHMRPNHLSYWRSLIQSKIQMRQLQSVVDDEPAVRALSSGDMDEVDEYQFALCSFFLGQYDQVVAVTLRLIRQNPSYAAPYVLQGLAYTAEKKYLEAQQSYLAVLQIFPNNQAAVEGLARAYYLDGNRQQALAILNDTAKFPFPPPLRQRFEALKGLYDQ